MRPTRRLRDAALLVPIGCLLLFMPPYVGVFDLPEFLFGIPLLHIFIFSVWLIGIVLTALIANRMARTDSWPTPDSDTQHRDDSER